MTSISNGFRHPLGDGFLTQPHPISFTFASGPDDVDDGFFVFEDFGDLPPTRFFGYTLGEVWVAVDGTAGMDVFSASNGTVLEIGSSSALGTYVTIRHDLPSEITFDGVTTDHIVTVYGNLDPATLTVSVGEDVLIGQKFVTLSGDRLHFEVRLGESYTNFFSNTSSSPEPEGWTDPTDFIESYRTISAPPGPFPEVVAGLIYLTDADGFLWGWDGTSAARQLIGQTGVAGGLTDIAVAPDGKLYGISTTSLYRVDPTTGETALVGGLFGSLFPGAESLTDAQGFDIDDEGVGRVSSGNNTIVAFVDLSTGAVTNETFNVLTTPGAGDIWVDGDDRYFASTDNFTLLTVAPQTSGSEAVVDNDFISNDQIEGLVSLTPRDAGGGGRAELLGFAGTAVYDLSEGQFALPGLEIQSFTGADITGAALGSFAAPPPPPPTTLAEADVVLAGSFLARVVYGGTSISDGPEGENWRGNEWFRNDENPELEDKYRYDDDYRSYLGSLDQPWRILVSGIEAGDLDPVFFEFAGADLGRFTEHGLYLGNGQTVFSWKENNKAEALIAETSIEGNKTLVIGLRGSDGADAGLQGQTWTKTGAIAYYQALQPLLKSALAYASSEVNAIDKVIVAGHSLGGTMVDIFTALNYPNANNFVGADNFLKEGIDLSVVSLASAGIPRNLGQDIALRNGAVTDVDSDGKIDLLSPRNFYISIDHSEDRVHFADETGNQLFDGLSPNSALTFDGFLTTPGTVKFPNESGYVIDLPNIANFEVIYTTQQRITLGGAPFQNLEVVKRFEHGFGAEHNDQLYWSNISALFGDQLFKFYSNQEITIGVHDYHNTQKSFDYDGSGFALFEAYTGSFGADNDTRALEVEAGTSGYVLGRSGNDIIAGAGGNDLLSGGTERDQIDGAGGDDLIHGGEGADHQAGGAGADTFFFDINDYLSATSLLDRIFDYNQGDNPGSYSLFEGDKIDISGIVGAAFASGQSVDDLWKVDPSITPNLYIFSVDPDGLGTGFGWKKIALIDGIPSGEFLDVVVGDEGAAPPAQNPVPSRPGSYTISTQIPNVVEGAVAVDFVLTRPDDRLSETVYVSTTVNRGSSNNGDYEGLLDQPLTFAAGVDTATVSVNILDDGSDESLETFGLVVQATPDPDLNPDLANNLASASFTIIDDDAAGSSVNFTENSDEEWITPVGGSESYDALGGTDTVTLDLRSWTDDITTSISSSTQTFSSGSDSVAFTQVENFFVIGGSGNDRITTGAGNDGILGLGGDDIIDGGAGIDVMDGGEGDDTFLNVGFGEVIAGGTGKDAVSFNVSAETSDLTLNIFTGEGLGGSWTGIEIVSGTLGTGDDIVVAAEVLASINGNSGTDLLTLDYSGGEGDRFFLDTGDTTGNNFGYLKAGSFLGSGKIFRFEGFDITGTSGNDDINIDTATQASRLSGGMGNDNLTAGAGADVLEGGEGDDTFSNVGLGDVVIGGSGTDRVTLALNDATENVTLNLLTGGGAGVADGWTGIEHVSGTLGKGDDIVIAAEVLASINGNSGTDLLTLDYSGGEGDRFFLDTGDTTGNNFGYLKAGSFLGSGKIFRFEGFDITGTSGNDDINIDTATQASRLSGGMGNDNLTAGAGADVLEGGEGDDTLTGGGGDDVFVKRPGESDDVITDFQKEFSADDGDKIDISSYGISFGAIVFETEAGGLRIRLGADSILLQGSSLGALEETDFVGLPVGSTPPTVSVIDTGNVAENGAEVTIDLLGDAGAADSDGGTLGVANVSVTDQNGAAVAFGLTGAALTIDPTQFAAALAAGESAVLTVAYDVTDGQGGVTPNTGQLVVDGLDGPFTWYLDGDGDRFGVDDAATNQTAYAQPAGTSAVSGDADDSDATVYPGAPEINDGKDNDQDGATDEDNTAPTANADSYSVKSAQVLTVAAASGLLDNDADPDGDPLTVQSITAPTNGTLNIATDGSFTYTPDAGFVGQEVLTYTMTDGAATTTADVTIDVENAAPVAVDDSYTVQDGEVLTVAAAAGLLANDTDADGDPLTVQSITAPTNGTLNIATDGSFTYTPDAGFVGQEVLTYTMTDGAATTTADVTIDVENAAPVAVDDSYSTNDEEALTVSAALGLLANDTDADGDPLTVQSITAPTNGTLNIATDGSFTYTPDAGFVGQEMLTYTITDGTETTTADVTIDVENAAPVAVDDSYTVQDGEVLTVAAAAGLLANDTDADGDPLTVQSITAPTNGTLNIATDGSFTYTPDAGFVGQEVLTYTMTDGAATTTADVTIDVENAAPVAVDDSYSTNDEEALTVSAALGLLANDTDADGDPLTVQSITAPTNGTLNIATDGSFTYTPDAGFVGQEMLTYTITDGTETTTADVTIDVENAAPVAVDDSYTVQDGEVLTVAAAAGLLANDTDADGDPLTVQSITAPTNGTLNIATDGSFTYTPDAGFVGQEVLTYTMTDGTETTTADVTIDVENAAPVAVDDSYTVQDGEVLTVAAAAGLLANDTDADGDPLTVQSITAPTNGTLNIATDGSFTYTPDAGFVGQEVLTYTMTDGAATTTADVTIDITEVTGPNVIAGGTSSQVEGTDDADLIQPNAGVMKTAIGGGGADVFDFADTVHNGAREFRTVLDYSVGEDMIELGDGQVIHHVVEDNRVLLFTDQDFDVLTVVGASSLSEIEFV